MATDTTYKLTYFDIEGKAEKIRLAFVLNGTKFEDDRINYHTNKTWKQETKFGQLPQMEVNGKEMFAQSDGLLRFAASSGQGMYNPVSEPLKMLKINEVMGLMDDFNTAWAPCLYLNMGRHEKFGHPKEWPAKAETVKTLRENFMKDRFPFFMKHMTEFLKASGGPFFFGEKPCIADLECVTRLRSFSAGYIDHVDKECLNDFPELKAHLEKFLAIPAVSEWYELQKKNKAAKKKKQEEEKTD